MRLDKFLIEKKISASILLTNGVLFLACKPTNIDYWELPKGQIDGGESPDAAAIRGFKEETNILLKRENLELVGKFPFHSHKDIVLFIYRTDDLLPISSYKCISYTNAYGDPVPEVEAYRYFKISEYKRMRYEFHISLSKAVEKLKG